MRPLRCTVRCTSLAVVALTSLVLPAASSAQTSGTAKAAHAAEAKAPAKPVAAPKDESPASTLPVRSVVLYKNGVGYFEHLGSVSGNQHVAIDFTTSQLNDVLQSLTVLDDNGGRIGGVNYNSTTPLAEQLKSLSLAMSDDPTSTELFQALRGQKVEVIGAPGGTFNGRLMSIESRAQSALPVDTGSSPDADVQKPAQARFYLTLVANSGAVRVIELLPTLSIRPLDASLQGQLDRYLELLSSTHTTGLRHLSLDSLGTGPRQLRVSYISEVPVWKSTYRIVFPKTATDTAILQGWAVVDNTIGSDWDNVQLSLVAGAPQSFIQPLSDPLYLRRPEVPISTEAQSTPQTHEAAEMATAAPVPVVSGPIAGQNIASANRNFGALAKLNAGVSNEMPQNQAVIHGQGFAAGRSGGLGSGSGNGYGPGMGGNVGGGVYRLGGGGGGGVDKATDTNVDENVTTNAFDDFFQYALAQPVTIHKNESAMVPILQQTLPVERVTLWSASEPKPLRALWLDNTSKLTFDSGNFSVFESGAFAGEGLLDPIHPAEKRLLSYATDQAVRVRPHAEPDKRELRRVRITPHATGQLPGHVAQDFAAESRTTYNVSNSADEPRTVVLEVPRTRNRTLAPDSKAAESTADLYRFRVQVPAHQSAAQLVADEGLDRESWQILTNVDVNGSNFSDQANYLRGLGEQAHAQDPTDALATQLKPLIADIQAIADDKTHLEDLQKQREALTTEETRTRENLTALKGNEGAKRFVDALNRSEDALEQNRQQTETTQTKQKSDGEALRQLLQTTTIEWQSPKWTAPAK